jgi:ABC-type branched-subunit amino acid transport system substrate-binding protein
LGLSIKKTIKGGEEDDERSEKCFPIIALYRDFFTVSLALAQQKAPIKIGVNMDVTGYAGWTGEPYLRAIQLYVEQVNAQGGIDGRPIELVIQDNETNPEKLTNDAARVIVEAMKVVKPLAPNDSVRFRETIEKIKDFPGVYGTTYTFSKDDHRGLKRDDCVMIQVKGGKFVMAK